MFDLSNALAIGGIVGAPDLQRWKIKILALNVEADTGNHSTYMVD